MKDQDQFWRNPPGFLQLADNEVHVWRVALDVPPENLERLQLVLVGEEIERARRFYFEKDRCPWIVARATLRMLLSSYLKVAPQTLTFSTNEYGKPSILSPQTGQRLHFNLSHSGKLALYAFACAREVGIDVEQLRSGIDCLALAEHFFSVQERAALSALPAERREEAFYLCWSRKEAYIKARGKGLSLPLEQFDVSLVPGEPARLLGSREEPGIMERWSMTALLPGTGYAGALVVEGSSDWQLSGWQWPG